MIFVFLLICFGCPGCIAGTIGTGVSCFTIACHVRRLGLVFNCQLCPHISAELPLQHRPTPYSCAQVLIIRWPAAIMPG